jgi:hypothetical protein
MHRINGLATISDCLGDRQGSPIAVAPVQSGCFEPFILQSVLNRFRNRSIPAHNEYMGSVQPPQLCQDSIRQIIGRRQQNGSIIDTCQRSTRQGVGKVAPPGQHHMLG